MSFSAINIASQALQAFQQALDVTGNNVSNSSTAGYSRQVANFSEAPSTEFSTMTGQAWMGNGVSMGSVTGIRDLFLQAQSNNSASGLGQTNAQLAGGQQIQSVFTDTTGSGIANDLSSFYNSWSSLASQPTTAMRLQVQQAGEQLATDVQHTYQQLGTMQTQAQQSTTQTIQQIQSLANTIAKLNIAIAGQSEGTNQPNSLVDQRDQAVSQLAGLVNINAHQLSNGEVIISVNQFDLVDQAGANTFPTNFNAANGTVSDANGTYNITGGQLAGEFSQTNSLTSVQGQLDNLANTLTTTVNSIMSSGTTANGTTNQNFFDSTSTGAGSFAVDPAILADANNIATGVSGNSGDTSLAQQIANSSSTAIAGLGNQSTTDYYNAIVSGVGSQVAANQSAQSTQTAVASQIQAQIQSVSGVNVDEELSNMIQYQNTYQAAAKLLTVADAMMSSLINTIQ
jgi:flagellar hook-associated protein 1 FlgK